MKFILVVILLRWLFSFVENLMRDKEDDAIVSNRDNVFDPASTRIR